jgi:hypothetical protein
VIDVLPTGSTVLLQVVAKGFQTYGDSYKIDKDQMAIEVKLNPPGEQYSIYKKHDQAADAGKSPDAVKSSDKAKPAEAAKQSDTSQPQPQ